MPNAESSLKINPGTPIEPRPLIPALEPLNKTLQLHHDSSILNIGNIYTINVPSGTRYLLVQAIDQNIRYVISGKVCDPSQTSGFQLIAGNDPLAIPVHVGNVVKFVAEAAGARLELQYCQ